MLQKSVKIFILAGEPSGDALGADAIRKLNAQYPDITWQGVGGPQMQAAGLPTSLFNYSELTLMGLAEVVPRIPAILRRINDCVAAITAFQPDIVITIDVPDFSFRLAKKLQPLRKKWLRLIHEVAPTVWAWRAGRAKKIAQLYDHLWCLFPFEPPYFEKYSLLASFIGHPVTQLDIEKIDPAPLQRKLVIGTANALCLLPGSRQREVAALLPIFIQAADSWRMQQCQRDGSLPWLLIPTLPHLESHVREIMGDRPNIYITSNPTEKYQAMRAASAAIAASGTVTLELAMANCPHLIAYQMHALTVWLARHLIKTPFANLVNIVLRKLVIPELLQADCTAEKILAALDQLDKSTQQIAFAEVRGQLQPPSNILPL